MKIILDGSSVIAVGGWNAQIFSPEWLKKHVCDDEECQIEIAIPVNNPTALPRLSFEDVHLFVSPSRLEFKPQSQDLASFTKCAKFLKKILKILSHTPVTSFGVNFAFVSDGDHEEIIPKFVLTDNALFDAEKNELKKTIIQRAFKQVDDSILNLSVTIENNTVVISFNYHNDVNITDACVEKLVDDIIERCYSNSTVILDSVYSVQVNEN